MGAISSKLKIKKDSKIDHLKSSKNVASTHNNQTYEFRPITEEERKRLRVDVYSYLL